VDVVRGDNPKKNPFSFYKKLDFAILKDKKKKKNISLRSLRPLR